MFNDGTTLIRQLTVDEIILKVLYIYSLKFAAVNSLTYLAFFIHQKSLLLGMSKDIRGRIKNAFSPFVKRKNS